MDSTPAIDRFATLNAPGQVLRAARTSIAAMFSGDDAPPALLAGVAALARLRAVAIIGQSAAIVVALWLSIPIAVAPMVAAIVVLVALTLHTRRRMRGARAATHHEIATHVAIDVAAFSVLLASSGGEHNPFVLLYLVHVVMIALLLPSRQAVVGVTLVVAVAALIALTTGPLVRSDGTDLPHSLLAVGWSLSFALTAAATAWVVTKVVSSLHAYGHELAEARRVATNDEALVRIGALAAGAAHELGTPLATMAVIVGEMQRNGPGSCDCGDVGILGKQIDACRQTLARLLARSGQPGTNGGGPVALDAFFARLFDRFRSTRPDARLAVDVEVTQQPPRIYADTSLGQALLNLLNNAADAARAEVRVTVRWSDGRLRFVVDDDGPGIPDDALPKLGREFFTTKSARNGTGLGLLLTATVIGGLGGSVRWSNRNEGGARAEVELPLAALSLQETTT
jgi:two-component system sensor histidine kinase RegB